MALWWRRSEEEKKEKGEKSYCFCELIHNLNRSLIVSCLRFSSTIARILEILSNFLRHYSSPLCQVRLLLQSLKIFPLSYTPAQTEAFASPFPLTRAVEDYFFSSFCSMKEFWASSYLNPKQTMETASCQTGSSSSPLKDAITALLLSSYFLR